MSFFNFRNQDKHTEIAQILASEEASSREALHQKHPHTRAIFAKHNIDLKKIRNKGVKTAATAAVLGAFLALPHLVGAPTYHPPKPPTTQTLGTETTTNPNTSSHNQNLNHTAAAVTTPTLTQQTTVAVNSSHHKDQDNDEDKDNDSQGHLHGRSYLAPPKNHGLHDLGYHVGAEKHPDQVSDPGVHPEKPRYMSKEEEVD